MSCSESSTSKPSSSTDGITKWTDDQIRWEDPDQELDEDDAPDDPFKTDDRETFDFGFDQGKINIQLKGYAYESDEVWKSTGLTIWRAAEYLCHYLVQRRDIAQGADQIIELGSGLGLCGILAYRLAKQSSNVVITDGDSDALIYLTDNVNANKITLCGKVSAQQLIWGGKSSKEFQQNHCDKNEKKGSASKTQSTFDLIIASDIIYAKCIVEPLWETIDNLLSLDGVFVMAYALREVPVSIDDVTEMGDKCGFDAECTQQNDKGDIFVYHFRRKR